MHCRSWTVHNKAAPQLQGSLSSGTRLFQLQTQKGPEQMQATLLKRIHMQKQRNNQRVILRQEAK